jgi:hypothetical protein
VEVFKIRLVEGVADNFNVQIVEVGGGKAFTEIGGWRSIRLRISFPNGQLA